MGMTEEEIEEKPALTKKEKTKADKQAEHIARIKRTLIASLLGILTGVISYWSGGIPTATGLQDNGFLAFMLMLAGIVVQKHIFILPWYGHLKTGCKRLVLPGIHDLCILVHDMDDPVDLSIPDSIIIKSFL